MTHSVLRLGATGTIGRATATALIARGHAVTCLVRRAPAIPLAAPILIGDVTDRATLTAALKSRPFSAIISGLASRTGTAADAWAIDHAAHASRLAAAKAANIPQFILLSAICVQKPRLAFQHAKLAFEASLATSGLRYSIVRPTACFKSLSGQINRLRAGQACLLFGTGRLTACKPISDADLAAYLTDCLTNPARHDQILPIGGPALTPIAMGREFIRLLNREPRFRHVPVALIDMIIASLNALGQRSPRLKAKAELACIGRYYATESRLVLNPATGHYDADLTPETGSDSLFDRYARLIRDHASPDRGDHAVFCPPGGIAGDFSQKNRDPGGPILTGSLKRPSQPFGIAGFHKCPTGGHSSGLGLKSLKQPL